VPTIASQVAGFKAEELYQPVELQITAEGGVKKQPPYSLEES